MEMMTKMETKLTDKSYCAEKKLNFESKQNLKLERLLYPSPEGELKSVMTFPKYKIFSANSFPSLDVTKILLIQSHKDFE